MKKTLFAALAALALAACSNQPKEIEPSVFEGRFIGYAGQYVEFFLLDKEAGFVEVPIKVAEDGTFCDTLKFGTKYDCALFADKYMFRLCIEEGKHYNAEFDLTGDSETNFRFIGDGEKENQYLADYWKTFRYADRVIPGLSSCETFEDFIAGINAASDPLYASLQAMDNKGFVDYSTKDLNSFKLSYIYYYPFVRISASGTYRPEQSYLDAVKKAPKLTDEQYSQMLNLFTGNAPYLFPELNLREGMRAVMDFTPKAARQKETMEALLRSYASAGTGKSLDGAYEFYKENIAEVNEDLCRQIEGAMSLCVGAQAPEIEFEDINGKIFHLADFQGKPLYIDLWASWCGPCCAEIPHLQKLVDSLGADPEIVCISISIDDERSNWTAKLAEENSTWPQFLATKDGMKAISKDYNVTGIPRFLLINPDGTLASINAPRPSDADVLSSLKAALK